MDGHPSLEQAEGEGGRRFSGSWHHDYPFIQTHGALGILYLLFLPKSQ